MKLGFRSKTYLGILFLLLLFGAVIFFMVSSIMKEALLEENRNRGISTGTILAARVAEPILVMDFLRMKTLVDETARLSDDISYIFVLDAEGETLVHTFKGGFPVALKTANTVLDAHSYGIRLLDTGSELIYDYAIPVLIGDSRFGTVRLGLLRTKVQNAINRLLRGALFSTGLGILLAGVLGAALARLVIGRIKMLHQSSEQVLRGDLDVQTAPPLKRNCWEIVNCDKKECPAYGNLYHRCWYLSGTLCTYCVEGDYAKKIDGCLKCPVYKKCSGDEIQSLAECFNSMTLSLKTHLYELKDAEKTLMEQRQLLRTILDATPDFVSLQDRDSVYQAVNKAFCRLVGKREDEIIGKTDFDLFKRKRAEIDMKEDQEILKSGKPLIEENEIISAKGRQWIHVVKIPVRDADGNIAGLLYSGRDITELKRVQEQLNHAQKMETVGELTAGIAHEINTPLGIVLGYSQLLIEDVDPGSQAYEDLKIMEKQIKICKKIVSDLLRFSRHTESKVALVDINQSVDDVISVVEHTFKMDRVEIHTDYDKKLPPVKGDKEKLNQVFINLLNNAYDAIEKDGIITFETRFDEENGELVISVTDTGQGISSENIEKIFDPFFTTKMVGKGTGLGLSVTYGIIQEHNGRIEVQSPPVPTIEKKTNDTKGTAFIIHLPVLEEKEREEIEDGKNIGTG
jgi:PAS domain S-box-containing protein